MAISMQAQAEKITFAPNGDKSSNLWEECLQIAEIGLKARLEESQREKTTRFQ